MQTIFRAVEPADYAQVRQLLVDIGLQQRVQDGDRFERMVSGANRTVVAVEQERVVGFARALFDGASNGYISTVAVAGDRRGQGIGRELVKRLMDVDHPANELMILERDRRGTATLTSMSPGDFSLQLRTVDSSGHTTASGFLGRCYAYPRAVEARVGFDIEVEPDRLPHLLREARRLLILSSG